VPRKSLADKLPLKFDEPLVGSIEEDDVARGKKDPNGSLEELEEGLRLTRLLELEYIISNSDNENFESFE
jgi:hypothetical protein